MGSVRRILPRLAILAAAGGGLVILLTAGGAGADEPATDPVGQLGATVSSLLPSDPPPPPADSPSAVPYLNPVVAAPVDSLTTGLTPVVQPAQQLLSSSGSAAPLSAGGASPVPAGGVSPGAPSLPSREALPVTAALDSTASAAALPELTQLTAPFTAVLSRHLTSVPGLAPLPLDPDIGALALPGVLSSIPDGVSLPITPPTPHPSEPAGALLRPATTPNSISNPSSGDAADPSGASFASSSPSIGTFSTDGQPTVPDPGAGSGPPRAPPGGTPSDPSHRGSTDHASRDYSALPCTDCIGVTRGESWHAGTDVEMSHTPPEPSVSPD